MRILHASALVASLAISMPAWAQSGSAGVQVQHSYSRAIPPEAATPKVAPAVFVPTAARPRSAPAVVTPQTVIPHPRPAIVSPADEAPRPVPAVAFREMAEEAVTEAVAAEPSVQAPRPVTAKPAAGNIDSATRCVAMAVYHEARGEPLRGQRAVADVVMNRARSGRWGQGACSVVNAPRQFSNRWSWSPPVAGVASWDRALDIARDAMSGVVSVSSRLMNFRAASMGAGGRSFMRLGNHVFW